MVCAKYPAFHTLSHDNLWPITNYPGIILWSFQVQMYSWHDFCFILAFYALINLKANKFY